MLILCDSKMPGTAKKNLSTYGEVVEFATKGIIYEAISGHPDIFFCPSPAGLIVAPNLPEKYFKTLEKNGIQYKVGHSQVGEKYPESARYNCLFTGNTLIYNPQTSDLSLLEINPDSEIISVKQGYTRCSLVSLSDNTYITSDHGIEKTLKQLNRQVLFVDPVCIKLQGFEHGFFGGACGRYENILFLCGSLSFFKERERIQKFAEMSGVKIIELYDGPPVDLGSILFIGT